MNCIIKEEFVDAKTALTLENLGFPTDNLVIVDETHRDGIEISVPENCYISENYWIRTNPQLWQVVQWLCDYHYIYIFAVPCIKSVLGDLSKADFFEYKVVINGNEYFCGRCDKRDDALREAIKQVVESGMVCKL